MVFKFLKLLNGHCSILFEVIRPRNEPKRPRAELFVGTVDVQTNLDMGYIVRPINVYEGARREVPQGQQG
jgi:hypothetical protein